MIASRTSAHFALFLAGFLIWSSAFLWLYGALSVGCAFGWDGIAVGPTTLERAVLVGLWLAHLALVAALLAVTHRRLERRPRRDTLDGFFANAAFWAGIVAFGITIVNYAPILGLSACL